MARRQSWGHTGRGAAETYTAPGFTTATWPDPRIQRLRTKNELTQGVCKAVGSPADKSTFPHLHGTGGQSSRPAALLSAVGSACLQETGEHLTSASSPNPTQPPKATTRIPMAVPETALKKAGCWQSAWKRGSQQENKRLWSGGGGRRPNPWGGWGAGSSGQRAPRPRCPGRTP